MVRLGTSKQAFNAFEVEVNQLTLTVDMMESEVGPLKTAFPKFQLEIATNLEKIRQNMDNQLERDRAEFLDEVHTFDDSSQLRRPPVKLKKNMSSNKSLLLLHALRHCRISLAYNVLLP